MVVKQVIAVKVKVFDHLLEVGAVQFAVAILYLILGQRFSVDISRVVPINTFECSVWLEVAHGCEYLPESLNYDLLLCIIDKDLLHFKLRIVAEHLSVLQKIILFFNV